jgi:hypothetical protein
MSFVIAAPEFMMAAATDLASLGSMLSAANAAGRGTSQVAVPSRTFPST